MLPLKGKLGFVSPGIQIFAKEHGTHPSLFFYFSTVTAEIKKTKGTGSRKESPSMWRKLRARAMARRREALVLEMAVWVIRETGTALPFGPPSMSKGSVRSPLDVEGRERISNVPQQANVPCDGIDLISATRKELIALKVLLQAAAKERYHELILEVLSHILRLYGRLHVIY